MCVKRPTGGGPLQWVELIDDDLRGMTNWTEAIEDHISANCATLVVTITKVTLNIV